jgi:hypothetical protein
MTCSDFQVDSDSRGLPRRAFQFRLRHLFFLTTAVAVFCGLVGWIGWESLFYVSVVITPIITLIVLSQTKGARPDWALRIGAVLPAVMSAGSYVAELVNAYGASSPRTPVMSTPFLVLMPVIAAIGGAVCGVLVSIPFLILWYLLRRARRVLAELGEISTSVPPETRP